MEPKGLLRLGVGAGEREFCKIEAFLVRFPRFSAHQFNVSIGLE